MHAGWGYSDFYGNANYYMYPYAFAHGAPNFVPPSYTALPPHDATMMSMSMRRPNNASQHAHGRKNIHTRYRDRAQALARAQEVQINSLAAQSKMVQTVLGQSEPQVQEAKEAKEAKAQGDQAQADQAQEGQDQASQPEAAKTETAEASVETSKPEQPPAKRRVSHWESQRPQAEVVDVELPQVLLRVDIEGKGVAPNRRFRASHTEARPHGEGVAWEKRSVVGPWRVEREDASNDADKFKNVFDNGGIQSMLVTAMKLLRDSEPSRVPPGVLSWQLQQNELRGGLLPQSHRVFCSVEHSDGDGTRLETFATLWRMSQGVAEDDLWSMFRAYQTGGYTKVKRIIANQSAATRLPGLL